ncbi:MAG: 2-polyprenyl-3-methyl-6-methoxy-1,4-benzoquinone monooxygenase [Gammaproteobacteria bacterium]
MSPRSFSLTDRLVAEADHALRVVAARPRASRPAPIGESEGELPRTEQQLGARLMRVNHSGEIAAQALYRGQAFVARDKQLRADLLEAAEEEHDHLAWCEDRTRELGSRVSLLAPAWYAGSFAIGALAGLAGDKISLGFLAETEKQVTEHLESHLKRLPASDKASRAIIEQMREDEIKHGQNATDRGGQALPKPIKTAMWAASKVMTTMSFRL